MIVFGFEIDKGQERDVYWLGTTDVTGEDEQHADEIYEQIMAHESYLDELDSVVYTVNTSLGSDRIAP